MTFALHVYGEVIDETFDPDTDAIGEIDLTDDAIEAYFTKVLHGAGSMKLVIPRTHPSADLLRQDRYVIPETDAGMLDIGFFLSEAEVDLSSEDEAGGEMLVWEGEGSGIVLERARMDDTSSITGGQNPIQGFWDLSNQGDFAGNSNGHPIPMMKRSLVEVNANSVDPIPMVDHSSWDYDLDSDSATPPFLGEIVFGVDVGDDLYAIWQRMVELGGVTFRMHRDFTFTSHLAFGTDRQGDFGDAGAVRFEKGVNVTVALKRKIHANVRKSHMIVGGAEETYVTVVNPTYSPGDIIRVGFLSVPETADETALEASALANFLARERAADAYVLPMPDHGNVPADGIYEPEVHFDVGDTPTFHTGTGVHDLNEEGLPVAAITWRTSPGTDYVYDVELGWDYHWTEGPGDAFGAGSQRRILFCPPAKDCHDLTVHDLTPDTATNGDVESGATNWSGGGVLTSVKKAGANSYGASGTTSLDVSYDFGSQSFLAGVRYVIDCWNHYTGDHLSTTVTFGDAGGDEEATTYAGVPGDDPPGVFDELVTGVDGNTWARMRVCWTPSADRTDVRVRVQGSGSGSQTIAVDDLELNIAPSLLPGVQNRAARCDHGHYAREIVFLPGAGPLTSDNVQDAIVEHVTDEDAHGGGAGVSSHSALTELDVRGDHPWALAAFLGEEHGINIINPAGATPSLDLSLGNVQDVTLTTGATIAFVNPGAAGVERRWLIKLRGEESVAWPAEVEWILGDAPEPATDGFAYHEIGIATDDGGASFRGYNLPGAIGEGGGTGDPSDDTHVWMPLTTVVGGVPELVWDANNSLIPTLVPLE